MAWGWIKKTTKKKKLLVFIIICILNIDSVSAQENMNIDTNNYNIVDCKYRIVDDYDATK